MDRAAWRGYSPQSLTQMKRLSTDACSHCSCARNHRGNQEGERNLRDTGPVLGRAVCTAEIEILQVLEYPAARSPTVS